MEERFDYGLNPKKLGALSSYLCDPATAPAEFLLVKSQYQAETGRAVERGALFFQIRQAFPPGEVTAEEANQIGYETAMRWTKGKYQFFVCTHTDKGHLHNHIYFNSTAFDRSRKFHNFIGSSFALRRLSDRVCIEHDLSVIQNPKQHSKGRYLHYGQWIGEKPPSAKQRVRLAIVESLQKQPADFPAFLRLMEESGFLVKHGRGGVISFLAPGQDKPTRLRASTLGDGFDPEDIRAVIAGDRPIPELPQEAPAPARRVNLIIDIQERMAQGKGPAYERWAKVYNLKQMAAALQYLRENDLMDYEALAASTEKAVERFHTLSEELRQTEAELEKTFGLPVTVANDANCMTLGEVWVGGAKGYTDVIGVTLGTGVGGGILTGGRLLEGARGLGGELGHFRTHALNGVFCTCGASGCWERYAATTALVRGAQPRNPKWKDGRAIFESAHAGDPTILALLDDWTDEIAQGLAGMVHIFNPQLILIGGGVSAQQELLIDPVAKKVRASVMPAFAEGLEIRAAQLHNDAGMVGAVYYFRQSRGEI